MTIVINKDESRLDVKSTKFDVFNNFDQIRKRDTSLQGRDSENVSDGLSQPKL